MSVFPFFSQERPELAASEINIKKKHIKVHLESRVYDKGRRYEHESSRGEIERDWQEILSRFVQS